MEYIKNFDEKRFRGDIFGVGAFPMSWDQKPGWTSWDDVKNYFGISSLKVDKWKLERGEMHPELKECLDRKFGKERIAKYFPAPEKPKRSKEQQELDDMATLLFGSVAEVNALKNRR